MAPNHVFGNRTLGDDAIPTLSPWWGGWSHLALGKRPSLIGLYAWDICLVHSPFLVGASIDQQLLSKLRAENHPRPFLLISHERWRSFVSRSSCKLSLRCLLLGQAKLSVVLFLFSFVCLGLFVSQPRLVSVVSVTSSWLLIRSLSHTYSLLLSSFFSYLDSGFQPLCKPYLHKYVVMIKHPIKKRRYDPEGLHPEAAGTR